MSLLKTLKHYFGIKPVKVGDLNKAATAPTSARIAPVRPATSVNPNDIEVLPEYRKVREMLVQGVPLVFVTGGAGTGKTTLIRYLLDVVKMRTAVVAPTGVAALNIGGVTIHSLFHFPPHVLGPDDIREVQDKRLYRALQLLIIDEVSMVRADVMDGIDHFLRLNRDSGQTFGGVQVLMIGDLLQLPPVTPKEELNELVRMGYQSDFFFAARGLSDSLMMPVVLSKTFRQEDEHFISLLNDVRTCKNLSQALRVINTRFVEDHTDIEDEIVLTSTNRVADRRNQIRFEELRSKKKDYRGTILGEFRIENKRLPSPMNLALKVGAQVMFTKNDAMGRWINGTVGTVVGMKRDYVRVKFRTATGQHTADVHPESWSQYEYVYDPDKERIVAKEVGRYTQIPLMLAWAVTIHKAQGKTLSKVKIDLGDGAFAPGQVYVALSRVRSLEDIRLVRPIREDEVICSRQVQRFYEQLSRSSQ